MTRLVLIDPNPINAVKKCINTRLWFIYIDAMEAAILLMIYVVKLVSQTKWKMQV